MITMTSKETVTDEEERLRKCVRALPNDQRFAFHQAAEKQLKDPDTYAALNYLFIAGLHHFYLGKWQRGLFNLCVFLGGLVLLFTPFSTLGICLIAVISIIELSALFKSQIIVQAHNNAIMKEIYRNITQHQPIR